MNNAKTIAASWLRKWYVICAIVIIVAGIAVRGLTSPLPDPVSIPTPTMPSPNARDTFTAAEKLANETAADDYAISTPLKGPPPAGVSASDPNSGYHVFTLAEKDALVKQNLPAMTLMRQGLTQKYMSPPARSFDTLIPYYAKDRGMARLFSLQAHDQIGHQDWNGAMSTCMDSIQLGAQLPHGSVLIGQLVGIACEAIGRRPILDSDLVDHLTSAQAKSAANRMAQINASEVDPSSSIQQEEYCTQASLLNLFNTPNWRMGFLSMANDSDGPSASRIPMMISLYTTSARASFERYTDHMNMEVAQAKRPWPQQLASPLPPPPHDLLSSVLFFDFLPAQYKIRSTLALDRLLEVQLALRAYDLEHASYPSSLVQLVPSYIPSVPIDPYSDNLPLIYRLSGSSYVLYSIGPDGVDDGGKPIDNTGYVQNMSKWLIRSSTLNINAKGDIVAGVND